MKNKTLKRSYNLIKPHIKTISFLFLLAIIIDILVIARPYLEKTIIDKYLINGITQSEFNKIIIICIIYIIMVILENVLDFFSKIKTDKTGEEILYELRNKIYKYTQDANINFHDKTPAGKLFVRITTDVEDISALFKEVIVTVFKDIVSIVAIISMMLYISWKFTIIVLLVMILVVITLVFFTYLLNKMYNKCKNIRTQINTFLAESIYGMKLIKIFNIQKEKQNECEKLSQEFVKERSKGGIYEGLISSVTTFLNYFAIFLMIIVGLKNWFGIGAIEIGAIYIMIRYTHALFEPINRIIENVEVVQEAFVSIDKIYDILEEKEYLEDFESGTELTDIKGKLEFKNVWFAYEGENWILKDVSFTIEPGETIALVGKTGSGKTTITNLVNRFYENQKGEILLDGVNIKDINKRSLRRNIGIILQDPFIFARSIKDNIKLNKKISDKEIDEAVKLSYAQEFIKNLPNGIDEIAKERGNSFSVGQKQLLAFARIFAHNPNIFILDEATANIDTHTEQLIQKSINKLSAEKTAIFIAHRLATIVNVDKIIVLDKGTIIEQGSHKELVASGGYYSKLYNSYYNSLG